MNINTYNVIWVESLDSTQTYLQGLNSDILPEWSIVATKNQKQGRGQGKNKWESEGGKNLTFSLLLKPTFLPIANQFLITQVLSLGICDFLSKYINDVSIKWPNDIYVRKNKICGMLVQNKIIGSEFTCAICGIGININQIDFHFAPNPTSMKLETKQAFLIENILIEILGCLKLRYDILKSKHGFNFKKEYLESLLHYNVFANYRYNNGEDIEAKIIDVNEFGHLVLVKKDKKEIIAELKQLKFYH
ncbi:MAG: biotin--[acetyl-CoA-carboxylase] ligase [Bacteroidales bacterium]|jgi:BirA family biotin operon repressor/biotin-[acetyl-CoA-carboxylase] ligase